MTKGDQLSEPQFEVVINLERQYSLWPADKPIPAGWRAVGGRGVKSACLAYIDEIWTDMRPLSLTFIATAAPVPHGAPGA